MKRYSFFPVFILSAFLVAGCCTEHKGKEVVDECTLNPASKGCWVIQNVHFDTNKHQIKPESKTRLNNVATVLKNNAGAKLNITGYTDSRGSDEYNKRLSQSRANSVKKYLVGKGAKAGNLSAKGLGEVNPVATNDTKEGMALNRRVELSVQ
ncbi:MAG: OmpA family protein [Nitrospinae bacterium]|nr:OmpA family protein [Nitrospinota bacterium]